jgi:vacuolar-type H+-ATPase subunit H
MCAAHEEMDQIHESEVAARERIEDAEKRARVIREEAENEAKALIAGAEHEARKTASKMLSDIEGKKGEIEAGVLAKTEQTIEKRQKLAEKRKDEAEKAVYKILLGEV